MKILSNLKYVSFCLVIAVTFASRSVCIDFSADECIESSQSRKNKSFFNIARIIKVGIGTVLMYRFATSNSVMADENSNDTQFSGDKLTSALAEIFKANVTINGDNLVFEANKPTLDTIESCLNNFDCLKNDFIPIAPEYDHTIANAHTCNAWSDIVCSLILTKMKWQILI